MSDKKRILVTGGAGYIGSHTVVSLIQEGYEPVLIDDFRNAHPDVIERLKEITNHNIICHNVDCCNREDLDAIFKTSDFDGVIHFAAYKAVGESVEQPLKYYRNNLVSLINVLELCETHQVQNIVFSSSCTVYGEPEGSQIVNEDTPLQEAASPYGHTKTMSEQILKDFHRASPSSNIFALRYFNPIGAHDSAKIGELPMGRPNNLVPFITQTAAGILEELTVYGNDYHTPDGTCVRDFIHVQDLADAHVEAIKTAEGQSGFFEAINIGTGKGTSVKELITLFELICEEKLNYRYGDRRPGDVVSIYADVSKAKKSLNWSAKRSLEEALLSAWNWQKNLKTKP
jgi:UDP-glucose 4-epimerase